MTVEVAREQLLAAFSPETVAAIEALIEAQGAPDLSNQASSPWLTLAQAAEYLHVSLKTVERRRDAGDLRAVCLDRHWLTRAEWLDDYVLSGGRGGDSADRSARL